jgi:hypothetical protein
MEAKIENLKKKKLDADKVLSNDDDDLRDMFYNLKNDLQNITEYHFPVLCAAFLGDSVKMSFSEIQHGIYPIYIYISYQ